MIYFFSFNSIQKKKKGIPSVRSVTQEFGKMCLNEGSPFSTVSRKMVVSEALTRDFAALDLQRCSSSSTTTTTRIVPIRVRGELHLPFVNREEVILKVIKTWMSNPTQQKKTMVFCGQRPGSGKTYLGSHLGNLPQTTRDLLLAQFPYNHEILQQ